MMVMRVAIGEIVMKCIEHANIFEQGDSRSRKGDHDEDGNKVLLGQNDKSWWLHRLPSDSSRTPPTPKATTIPLLALFPLISVELDVDETLCVTIHFEACVNLH